MAIVDDAQVHVAILDARLDRDSTPFVRVLCSIGRQVGQDLQQALGIRLDQGPLRGRVKHQLVSLGLHHRPALLYGVQDRLPGVERDLLQVDQPPCDARHVQQIVDEACHVPHLRRDDVACASRTRRIGIRQPQQIGSSGDRRERVAQFMGQHGEELVLVARTPAQFA